MPSLKEMREFNKRVEGILDAMGREHGVQRAAKMIRKMPCMNADMETYIGYMERYDKVRRRMVRDLTKRPHK